MPMTYDLLEAIASKPRYGEPCNGCGACCATSQCIVSEAVFGTIGKDNSPWGVTCPAFEPDGKETKCGIVRNPIAYAMTKVLRYGEGVVRQATLQLIFAGEGCDARFNGEPRDVTVVQRWIKMADRNSTKINNAYKIWGIRN